MILFHEPPPGGYGVKSAAAIVLPPQSCALAFGAIKDTVIPRVAKSADEPNWEVCGPILLHVAPFFYMLLECCTIGVCILFALF